MNMVAEKNTELRAVLPHEIIEIGAVKLDESFGVIERFCSYVRPRYNHRVHWTVAKLTGITTKQLQKAAYLEEVLPRFAAWMGEDAQLYAWSASDRAQLEKELSYKQLWTPALREACSGMVDFQREFSCLLGYRNGLALGKAIAYMGLDFDGAKHDALSDAENCARLMALVQDEREFARRKAQVPPEPLPPRRAPKRSADASPAAEGGETAPPDVAEALPQTADAHNADGRPAARRRHRHRGRRRAPQAPQPAAPADSAPTP